MIEAIHLSKTYSSGSRFSRGKRELVHAVNDVSLHVDKGQIFGMLGVNGAGKTTLVKMLSTLLLPSSGEAFIAGRSILKDSNQIRSMINMVSGGDRMLYWRLTGRENLNYFADLYNVTDPIKKTRVNNLLEMVGLTKAADTKVEKYSKGMKQRLQIARGLINDPQVLFMDEPTLGLDAPIARELRQLIKHELGKTILFTSHYIAEVEEICDRVAIIHNGKIITEGSPADLRRDHRQGDVLVMTIVNEASDIASVVAELNSRLPNEVSVTTNQEGSHIRLVLDKSDRGRALEIAEQIVRKTESQLTSLRFEEPSLEDVLIAVVGGANQS
jgi:ABC-2 type transport system ATP-binding protein